MHVYLIGHTNFFRTTLLINIVLAKQERKVHYSNYGHTFFFENSSVWSCMRYIYNMWFFLLLTSKCRCRYYQSRRAPYVIFSLKTNKQKQQQQNTRETITSCTTKLSFIKRVQILYNILISKNCKFINCMRHKILIFFGLVTINTTWSFVIFYNSINKLRATRTFINFWIKSVHFISILLF